MVTNIKPPSQLAPIHVEFQNHGYNVHWHVIIYL